MLFIECATRFAGSANVDDKFFPLLSVYKQIRAQEIFGGSSVDVWENDVWSKNNGNAGRGDLEGAMKQMNVREDFGESLFDRARKIPIGKWNPSDMANCGLIGKGIRRVQKVKLQARYYVFSSYCMGWFMERLVKKKLLMVTLLCLHKHKKAKHRNEYGSSGMKMLLALCS
ncbi:hypothetical protein Tcan_18462 [Toxocara canis]|uniref:Uncharacterized protein n=1 Tax=Toxocara canis TaxID=6265 RepID=A0A0B2UX62_TOXCA|nr:hypothetical protein Tcan_18462 [Toxocara canis]